MYMYCCMYGSPSTSLAAEGECTYITASNLGTAVSKMVSRMNTILVWLSALASASTTPAGAEFKSNTSYRAFTYII